MRRGRHCGAVPPRFRAAAIKNRSHPIKIRRKNARKRAIMKQKTGKGILLCCIGNISSAAVPSAICRRPSSASASCFCRQTCPPNPTRISAIPWFRRVCAARAISSCIRSASPCATPRVCFCASRSRLRTKAPSSPAFRTGRGTNTSTPSDTTRIRACFPFGWNTATARGGNRCSKACRAFH